MYNFNTIFSSLYSIGQHKEDIMAKDPNLYFLPSSPCNLYFIHYPIIITIMFKLSSFDMK